mmetsp:Transcript_36723/g.65736  ORF Transcript_36723/g.65736 Transcript_36723/m.65736 type:complete len:214 (+) Transcript_36723:1035-1676(+)
MTATWCMPAEICVVMRPPSAPFTRTGTDVPSHGGSALPSKPEAQVEPVCQTFPPAESKSVKCNPAATCFTDSGPRATRSGTIRPSSSPTPRHPLSPPPQVHTMPREPLDRRCRPAGDTWRSPFPFKSLESPAGASPEGRALCGRGSFWGVPSRAIATQEVCQTPAAACVTLQSAKGSTFRGTRHVSCPPWPSFPPNPSPQVYRLPLLATAAVW